MTRVKVTAIGNSLGIVLPQEVREALGVIKGDYVVFLERAFGVALVPAGRSEKKKRRG